MLHAGPAAAHAPPEATGILWTSSGSNERTVVRTNRGLIVSDDRGQTFRLLCNDAFGASLTEVAPVVATSTGRLLVASYLSGLLAASDDLCTFKPVPGPLAAPTNVVGIEPAGAKSSFLALVSRDGSSDHLFASADDGVTWRAPSNVEDFSFSLAVAPSDPKRFYVTALHNGDGGTPAYRLLVTADGGATFRAHDLALDASESGVTVLAVDPSLPDRVFLKTTASDPTLPARLQRSDDGGATLVDVLSLVAPTSAVTSPDGATVWVGGQYGLFRSADHGKTFTPLASANISQVACLALHNGRLFACGYADGVFGVLASSDAGDSFSFYLRFPDVKAPLDCPPDSVSGRACAMRFEDWRIEQGLASAGGNGGQGGAGGMSGSGGVSPVAGSGGTTSVPETGGAPSVPGTGGAPSVSGSKSGGGCRVGARQSSSGATTIAFVAVMLLVRRRRNRRSVNI